MSSKALKSQRRARLNSPVAEERVGRDKPPTVIATVASPGEAPPAPQLSSPPGPQSKEATKDSQKRGGRQKGTKSLHAASEIKGAPAAISTQKSPTVSSPSAFAPAAEVNKADQQEQPADPGACASAGTSPQRKQSTARRSRATSVQSTASKAASMQMKEDSIKALNELLTAGKEPASNKNAPSPSAASKRHLKASMEAKVFVTILVVGAVVAFTLILRRRPVPISTLLCTTESCARHWALIESQLDKNMDPCKDFDAYVCGHWTPRKQFAELSRSALTDMVMTWQANLPDTLLGGVARLPAGRKALAMYNSCVAQSGSQVGVFKEFMSKRGLTWPEDLEDVEGFSPLEILFDLAFNWNVNLWFSLNLLPPAADDSQKRRLFFAPNNFMLEWRTVFKQIPRQFFDKVYRAMFKLYANDAHATPSADEITEAYNMLGYIFDLFISSSSGKARVPAVLPLQKLDDITQLTNTTYLKCVIDTKLAINPPFTMEDLWLMTDVTLMNATLQIFGSFNDSRIRRNLAWLFLEAYGAVANPETILLVLHGSQSHAQDMRPLFCASQVEASYKLLVAAMVAVMHFTDEQRRNIDSQLASIVETAAEKASAAPWLDNKTQHVAAAKLRTVHSVLWPDKKFLTAEGLEKAYAKFPERAPSFAHFWIETRQSLRGLIGSDAGLEQLRIAEGVAQPYVQYVHVLNQLSLSLGALAPPFYYKNGTKAMFYGGLGYLYAKELVRAVDREGVKVDHKGNIVSSWLSDAVKAIFEDRVLGCLPGGNPDLFTEVPAMEVAFAAWKRNFKHDDVRLSETMTEEQVFFITACLLSCSQTPADNLYGGDCNKAVANFAPFAEAFQCRPGSNMNPITKCTFFD